MGNSSNGLIIAGIVLICILIISAGMFAYNSSKGTIETSESSLSSQEIDSFNNQFLIYRGLQNATGVKNLLSKLVVNAGTYSDDIKKIPAVYIDRVKSKGEAIHAEYPINNNVQEYIKIVGKIKNGIQKNHNYWIEMNYQNNGLIDYIIISYDPNNIEAPKHR